MIGIVTVLFCIVLVVSFREPKQHGSVTDENSVPAFNSMGVYCLLILLAYVLALQFNVPFVIASAVGIFLLGATIAKWEGNRLFAICQLAIIFSLSIELVFTKLFTVALP